MSAPDGSAPRRGWIALVGGLVLLLAGGLGGFLWDSDRCGTEPVMHALAQKLGRYDGGAGVVMAAPHLLEGEFWSRTPRCEVAFVFYRVRPTLTDDLWQHIVYRLIPGAQGVRVELGGIVQGGTN